MKELIVGLALAGVSGITFIAYKHPKAYREVQNILLGLAMALAFIVVGIYAGRDGAIRRLLPFVPMDKRDEAMRTFAEAIPIFESLVVLCLFAAFLMFLRLLPVFLEQEKQDKRPNSPRDKEET